MTILQRDGHPTALGEALAAYDRIFKTCPSWATSAPTNLTAAT